MMFAPLEGRRHVKVTDRHTAVDYARALKELADIYFAHAKTIVLVQDNLSIHSKASLYEAFPAVEVRRLVERFEWHYTPKHGSWLNLAESELGVPSASTAAFPTNKSSSTKLPPGSTTAMPTIPRPTGNSPVLSENHIRTYWWCSPDRIGMATMTPDRWIARPRDDSSSRRHFVECERETRRAIAAGERDMLAQHTDESFRADDMSFRNAGGAVVQVLMRSDFFATEAFFCDHGRHPFLEQQHVRYAGGDLVYSPTSIFPDHPSVAPHLHSLRPPSRGSGIAAAGYNFSCSYAGSRSFYAPSR